MHNVSHHLLRGVLFHFSAYAIWEDMRERFDKVTTSRMFYLHKTIFTLTKGTSSISVYYSKLKDLWGEYDSLMPPPSCECTKSKEYANHLQYQRLLQFLMGLNDGYSHARSQILMKSHVPNINQAYAMLLQDESQKMVAGRHYALTENMDPTALFTAKHSGQRLGNKNYNLECDYCHTRGHSKDNCFKLMKCDFCNMKVHLKENCYKIIRYPPDFKP
ncbi:uncharacterized protein LOC142172054 [Nicotiana tabacum]|uniref:Uncharacterized protein LOC142172054 n=1 Tax=Nicotiana tabacum TaxID=4097 RepID=A0AC58T422_TOBAC